MVQLVTPPSRQNCPRRATQELQAARIAGQPIRRLQSAKL
jgi:hypothetical protein